MKSVKGQVNLTNTPPRQSFTKHRGPSTLSLPLRLRLFRPTQLCASPAGHTQFCAPGFIRQLPAPKRPPLPHIQAREGDPYQSRQTVFCCETDKPTGSVAFPSLTHHPCRLEGGGSAHHDGSGPGGWGSHPVTGHRELGECGSYISKHCALDPTHWPSQTMRPPLGFPSSVLFWRTFHA